MSLEKSTLEKALLKAFMKIKETNSPGFAPLLSPGVALALAEAYHEYAKDASAGPLVVASPGIPSALAGILSVIPLFAGWGPGLLAYWTPVTFAGPGFIPVNPTIPVAVVGVTAEIVLMLPPNPIKISSETEFVQKFADILHRYTTQIMVTATTTSAPPVVSTIPVG